MLPILISRRMVTRRILYKLQSAVPSVRNYSNDESGLSTGDQPRKADGDNLKMTTEMSGKSVLADNKKPGAAEVFAVLLDALKSKITPDVKRNCQNEIAAIDGYTSLYISLMEKSISSLEKSNELLDKENKSLEIAMTYEVSMLISRRAIEWLEKWKLEIGEDLGTKKNKKRVSKWIAFLTTNVEGQGLAVAIKSVHEGITENQIADAVDDYHSLLSNGIHRCMSLRPIGLVEKGAPPAAVTLVECAINLWPNIRD